MTATVEASAVAARRGRPPQVFAVVLILFWLPLGVGGVQLLLLGGSPYYLVAAIVFILSAALLWRGERRGAQLYLGGLFGTVVWSLWEVGFDGWALMPRLLLPALLGLWLLMPWVRRGLA